MKNQRKRADREQVLKIGRDGEIRIEWVNPEASDLVQELLKDAEDEGLKRFRLIKGKIYCG